MDLIAIMSKINQIKSLLKKSITIPKEKLSAFYKTGPGQYAEHDQFLGVSVPILRKIAKQFKDISMIEIQDLITSPWNEERLLALLILVDQYQAKKDSEHDECYQFYMKHLKQVNNWNLVDSSAHLIIGDYLLKRNKKILVTLAKSETLWERRVAIVSTWHFIRNNELTWTFKIAKLLLNDQQDLIHKAVGWMLREAGKRSTNDLIIFLEQYAEHMPRTMLRYAIEKFPEPQRKTYLRKTYNPA